MNTDDIEFQKCTKCKLVMPKTTTFFYTQKYASGNVGLRKECKLCYNIRTYKNEIKRGRKKYNDRHRKYRQENKSRRNATVRKYRAHKAFRKVLGE